MFGNNKKRHISALFTYYFNEAQIAASERDYNTDNANSKEKMGDRLCLLHIISMRRRFCPCVHCSIDSIKSKAKIIPGLYLYDEKIPRESHKGVKQRGDLYLDYSTDSVKSKEKGAR